MGSTQEFNFGVRAWTLKTQGKALDSMTSMGVRKTGTLFRKLRSRLSKERGGEEIELIQFTMPRYGFIQQTQGGKGSTASYEGGKRILRGGKPRPFLRDAIEDRMDELADFVANQMADRNVDHTKIGINIRE